MGCGAKGPEEMEVERRVEQWETEVEMEWNEWTISSVWEKLRWMRETWWAGEEGKGKEGGL